MSLRSLATKLLGNLAEKYSKSFLFLKDALLKADLKIPFRSYLSLIFFITLLTYLSALTLVITYFFLFKLSFFLLIPYLFFIPLLAASISLIIMIYYPIYKAAQRSKNIETNLPFVLTHMGAIAETGVPPQTIFRLISEFEEYGEIAKEMKKIVRNIETFGMNPLAAVKEVAKRTSNENFKQILLGFVSTTESGGNVKVFLKTSGEQALFDWKLKREKFLQQLSTYAEIYVGVLIAAPLLIISMFTIMNLIQPTIGGFDILFLTKLTTYTVIPALNIGFILFIKGLEVEI
jgi:flagellar protein FlaJ